MKACAIRIVLSILFSMPVFSQTSGEITGEVKDTAGAVIVGAKVTVTNTGTNATRETVTTGAGVYNFPSLQPGFYNIRVEQPGFRAAVENNIELQVQQTARLDFTLQVGQLSESIEVAAAAVQLNTDDATVGTVIENRRIVDLPLNGRDYLQLVALSPNVSFGFANGGQSDSRQGGTRANEQISVAGQRREFNYFTLDGVDNTDVNFNSYIIQPSIDALQEFKVQTGIYPAEFGRATTQINVSTKPGTNDYHGTVFEFLRNDKLDARPYDFSGSNPSKSPFKWNQYGFTLGGPIQIPKLFNGKNKLFFMSNYEAFRQRELDSALYTVPDNAMRNGDFSELLPGGSACVQQQQCFNLTQPFSSTPIPGNRIPQSQLDPIAQKLLAYYPAPNLPNVPVFGNNLLVAQRPLTNKDQFIQRIDFNESSNSSWFGRYSWGDEALTQPALFENGRTILTHVWQAMISNTRVLSPTKVNEFRFGTDYFFNSTGRELAFKKNVIAEVGLPNFPSPDPVSWGIPSVCMDAFSCFGDDTEGPYVNHNTTFQWTDNFSWIHGKHSFRFGTEIRRDRFNQLGNQFARGSLIIYNGKATGFAFADYMIGQSSQDEKALTLAVAQFRATSQAYYVDDVYKIRPNLTINYGVRYELVPPWYDKGQSEVDAYVPFIDTTPNVADMSRHPVLVRVGSGDFYQNKIMRFDPAIQVARDGRLGDRLITTDYTNFAPRLGIAWSPTSKWTVRTGAGIFYSQDTGNPRFDMERNFGGRLRDNTSGDNPLTFERPFVATGVTVSRPYVLGNIHDRRTPMIEQYMLNMQRELDSKTVLEIGYLGSEGHHLEHFRAINEAIPGPGSVKSRDPYPEFGRIQEVDGEANSHYNALTVKVTRRFSQGLTYLAGYTWSKSIDTGSGIRTLGSDTLFPQDSYCGSCEKALSVFDTRNRFVTSLLYELPFGKGKHFLNTGGLVNQVLGGWNISSIITIQPNGFPLTVMDGDVSNVGAGFDRPNATGQATQLSRGSRNVFRWFNTGAYVQQPDFTFGNIGRNTVIGPGIVEWDFSTLKDFHFTEARFLQFRFEAFNFLNHPNWGDPDTYLLDGTFGQINYTRTAMRQLQLSLKLVF